MATSIAAGEVLHWANFQFEDGSSQNKFFVVLGAKPGHNMLLVIATSRKKRRRYDPGCDEKEGYFHISNGGRDVFETDTCAAKRASLAGVPVLSADGEQY